MNMAWKEMKRNKLRFLIVGSIIFLISFLTFMISGLANGLSQDNSALIKSMPKGHFYMNKEANNTFNLSKIDTVTQNNILVDYPNALAMSIQMGFVNDSEDKQYSVAFVASTESTLFPNVNEGEIILDATLQAKGIQIGDHIANDQLDAQFKVIGFVQQQKFSHAPVAFIHELDYKKMYRAKALQLIFIPNDDNHSFDELVSFTNNKFLNTISSYKAEQMTLNMIMWFLVVISGLLFAIFFYMMNVQKIGLYGILKALGVKTIVLFRMMWAQMLFITIAALILSIAFSQLFNFIAPEGMPFHLTMNTTIILSLLFIVIGFMGSTLSGIQIKKVEPLQAIRQGEM